MHMFYECVEYILFTSLQLIRKVGSKLVSSRERLYFFWVLIRVYMSIMSRVQNKLCQNMLNLNTTHDYRRVNFQDPSIHTGLRVNPHEPCLFEFVMCNFCRSTH